MTKTLFATLTLALVVPVRSAECGSAECAASALRTPHSRTPALPHFAAAQAASAAAQWQDVIRNLRHPEARVRLEALEQLGAGGYVAAAEYVAPLVTDPDDRVQAAAIDTELTFFLIESIGGRRVFSLTGGSRSRAQEAFDAGPLVRSAAPAPLVLVDSLATAMRDENARIRFDAIHALGVIAEAPLPAAQASALADGMEHYDAVIRAATARVIGRLRARGAAEKLIAGLNDSSMVVRRYAAEALGLIREERAVQSLTELTAYHGTREMAAETLLALARIAHGSARDLFRQRLSDTSPAIRRAAAEGLGRLRDAESLETLKSRMTAETNGSARLAATFAVGQMAESQAHVLAGALAATDLRVQAGDYLLEIGAPAIPGVRAAIDASTDTRFRADLLHLLGFIGTRETIALVEPFREDKNEGVKRAALNAIARLNR
jgi:HEAT repeat protein